MKKRGFIPIILGSLYLLTLTACQKSGVDRPADDDDDPPPGEVWVITQKQVQNFDTVIGVPLTIRAGYLYDTLSRTIVYRDTARYNAIADAFNRETIHTYDAGGRIIRVQRSGAGITSTEVTLTYNGDSLLQKVQEGNAINFAWTPAGGQLTGQSTDEVATGGPYSVGNKIYTLNSNRQLMTKVHVSSDAAYGNSYDEVVRNANGNVTQRRLYEKKNNVVNQYDSIVYERDETHAPRLSRFYELLGKGITWYSGNTGIRFLESPSFYSEYFEFENSLCNKIIYFDTNKNASGQWVTIKIGERVFQTEYDGDGNPVKQTVSDDGVKLYEITFSWKKIKWLN